MHADVNECTAETHQCQQVCQNTIGSYMCTCNSGFVLDGDGRTCRGMPKKVIVESKVSLSHNNIIQMLWNALMALTPASKCA